MREHILAAVKDFPAVPYGHLLTEEDKTAGLVEGCTKALYWKADDGSAPNLLLPKGNRISCVYATVEVFVDALHKVGIADKVSFAKLRQFQKHAFVVNDDLFGGIGEAIETLGWGESVAAEDVQPGDVAQIWDYDDNKDAYVFGHSVIVMSEAYTHNGRKAFDTFSAERSGSLKGTKKGGGLKSDLANEWRYLEHPKDYKTREIYAARPVLSMITRNGR